MPFAFPPGHYLVILGGGGGKWPPPGMLADPRTHPHQKITLHRLLDQSQAGPHRGGNATYPPFWAYLRTKGLHC